MSFEKNLDIFPTTYAKDFRFFRGCKPAVPYNAFDPFMQTDRELQENFYVSKIEEESLAPEQIENMKAYFKDRLKSIYQVDYTGQQMRCSASKMKQLDVEDDALIQNAATLYSPTKRNKPMPPINSTARVMGFCPPRDFYTGLSEYQMGTSYYGYVLLKEDADKGNNRRAPKFFSGH